MKKTKLSKKQIDRMSEILGNAGIAWFTIGVVSPLFAHPFVSIDFLTGIVVGCTGTGILTFYSIYIIRERKQK